MKVRKAFYLLKGLMVICVVMVMFAVTAIAQSKGTFIDASNTFSITLSDGWQAASYTDAFSRKRTEFIRGQRDEGLLRISRNNLGGRTLDQVVNRELEGLRFYSGKYLLAGREPFEGDVIDGMKISFYYIENGHRATGTYYFLKDPSEVWILRFTGQVGSLDANRDVTDEIARSFRPKFDYQMP